ncbi:MAG: sn-glycerol-3-phosphate ABC transporter ATP-binding protein UgpC [Clostridia bacterium]|nr:sn-glycerol-3-phosphate ABC transporter ATP-binding protein UgpC [Clostridia bacterium]
MASISLRHIKKVYANKVCAVDDFNLEIHDKEFVVFVGPSGCGKTTTLRMIAGLEEITEGELYIDDRLVNNVEPKDRDIAMVFQNYALYPYMTVFENMSFGLKLRKIPKREIEQKVLKVAKTLGLTEYLDRKPKELSGGQRQRVALGRAIVREPKVFLLDEPLSNLDAKMRTQMRTEIIKLHKDLETTFVYVTHDQTEAMTMGSRIVVMNNGLMQQVDTPENLYDYPVNKFVAGFIGSPQMNLMDVVLETEDDRIFAVFGNHRLAIDAAVIKRMKVEEVNKRQFVMGIRSEDISLDDEYGGEKVKVAVKVQEKLGNEILVYCDLAGKDGDLAIRAKPRTKVVLDEEAVAYFDMKRIHLFDYETGESILKR